ncbi:hypothetical protein CTI14_34305 [Methylobacterium radiotolerans]|nr:hypothetical protein CTI14_34305 [Methylobacterium radiotolerans]
MKAYLSAWEGMTTPEPLSRTYQLSRPVAAFHAALLYVERILPALEAKWEMQNMAMWALQTCCANWRRWHDSVAGRPTDP